LPNIISKDHFKRVVINGEKACQCNVQCEHEVVDISDIREQYYYTFDNSDSACLDVDETIFPKNWQDMIRKHSTMVAKAKSYTDRKVYAEGIDRVDCNYIPLRLEKSKYPLERCRSSVGTLAIDECRDARLVDICHKARNWHEADDLDSELLSIGFELNNNKFSDSYFHRIRRWVRNRNVPF